MLIRDVVILFKNYARSGMIVDFFANAPVIIYGFTIGSPTDEESILESQTDGFYRVCLGLKLLRITHAIKVEATLVYLIDKLSDILHWKKYVFDNLLRWCKAMYTFMLGMHILACGWVLIVKQKTFNNDPSHYNFKHEGEDIYEYFESLYFITTTISTVGYGDIDGFIEEVEGTWTIEMSFLIFTIVIGILLFSVVTNEIFNYKKVKTINEIVQQRVQEMELFLNSISNVIKFRSLSQEMIDECTMNMG